MPNTRTFYGFKDKDSGELVRVECRGDENYLSRSEGYPLFEAQSAEQLADVLFDDTPYYNSSPERPGWGCFKAEQLVPVKVTISVDAEELELPEPAKVRTLELREIPTKLAERYVGGTLAGTAKDRYVFWLVQLPDGETLETARAKWVGTAVYAGDRYTKRRLYAVAAVPEEYEPLTTGKGACALFIASSLVY